MGADRTLRLFKQWFHTMWTDDQLRSTLQPIVDKCPCRFCKPGDIRDRGRYSLAQLALHNPHIWANSLKPVCFLCFLLFWCPLLPFIETGTLKIYTKMVLYMKNEFLTSNTPSMGFEPTLYQP